MEEDPEDIYNILFYMFKKTRRILAMNFSQRTAFTSQCQFHEERAASAGRVLLTRRGLLHQNPGHTAKRAGLQPYRHGGGNDAPYDHLRRGYLKVSSSCSSSPKPNIRKYKRYISSYLQHELFTILEVDLNIFLMIQFHLL